jgi:hypothetical protein
MCPEFEAKMFSTIVSSLQSYSNFSLGFSAIGYSRDGFKIPTVAYSGD